MTSGFFPSVLLQGRKRTTHPDVSQSPSCYFLMACHYISRVLMCFIDNLSGNNLLLLLNSLLVCIWHQLTGIYFPRPFIIHPFRVINLHKYITEHLRIGICAHIYRPLFTTCSLRIIYQDFNFSFDLTFGTFKWIKSIISQLTPCGYSSQSSF